ncbi:MAG: endonuclease V [Nanoarchaeota archaeon]|nr:endonuclease V [Nanoarchaeota archaeon]
MIKDGDIMNLHKMMEEQERLAKKILTSDSFDELNYVGACDMAFTLHDMIASVVVLEYKSLDMVERKYAIQPQRMPYKAGFRSYREAPIIIEAFNMLRQKPDVMFVTGNGILHPRRFGLASHLGLALDVPTIGVAKKLLCGELKDGKVIVDKEIRAVEVRTKPYAKPLYVSPGHRMSMKTAMKVFNEMLKKHKLPEPMKLAHRYANDVKKKIPEKEF